MGVQPARALEVAGVVFQGETLVIPGKVKLAGFTDPDGNRLRLAGLRDEASVGLARLHFPGGVLAQRGCAHKRLGSTVNSPTRSRNGRDEPSEHGKQGKIPVSRLRLQNVSTTGEELRGLGGTAVNEPERRNRL